MAKGGSAAQGVSLGTGIVVVNPTGEVLMAQRLGAHGLGRFSIAGGAVDAGEDIEEAALRELKEETGIQLESLTFIGLTNNRATYAVEGTHFASATFLATNVTQVPKHMEPDKLGQWRWYALDNIPRPQFEASALSLELYRRYLETGEPALVSKESVTSD